LEESKRRATEEEIRLKVTAEVRRDVEEEMRKKHVEEERRKREREEKAHAEEQFEEERATRVRYELQLRRLAEENQRLKDGVTAQEKARANEECSCHSKSLTLTLTPEPQIVTLTLTLKELMAEKFARIEAESSARLQVQEIRKAAADEKVLEKDVQRT